MDTFLLLGIITSFLFAGFFAGVEIGFVSLNRLSVELRKKQRSKNALILSELLESPSQFISVMIVGISISISIYGMLVDELLTPLWKMIEGYLLTEFIPFFVYIRILFDLAISATAFIFYFFFCRAVFRAKSDTLMFFITPLLTFFNRIFYPIAIFFVTLSQWILKNIIGLKIKLGKNNFTKLELEHFLQQDDERTSSSKELDNSLFEAALTLPYVKIRQCLVPRKEIEAISIHESIDTLRKRFISTNLSKLVVYEKNIDNIKGYVHQLSLFKDPSTIQSVMLPIPAVPESMPATDLMNILIKERKSMAWVVDEFGGTSGIVTMEDILEEIFGEIKDEYDTEEFVEKTIKEEEEYIFSGRLEIEYIKEKYKLDIELNSSETLSGFIIHHHESIPKQKEKIIIGKYEFEILSVTETRIELVKLTKAI
jgi:CBS domain containing-hemolysin-like protein